MNAGLYPRGDVEQAGVLVGHFLEPFKSPAASAVLGWKTPVASPALIQPLVRFIAAFNGYAIGDLAYFPDPTVNAGATTLGFGVHNNGYLDVGFKMGSEAAGPMNFLGMNGTAGYVNTSTGRLGLAVIGRADAADGRLSRLHVPVQRFQTEARPLAAAANYAWRNLLERQPLALRIRLKCLKPEIGYKAGDIIGSENLSISTSAAIFALRGSPALVELRTGAAIYAVNWTTGAAATITPGNWSVYLDVMA